MKGWTFFDVIVWFSFLFFIFSSQGACFCARILMSSLLKGDCFLALLPLFSHESTILTWELGHSLLVLVPGVSPHCFTPWRVPTVLILPPLLLQFIQDQPSDHSWGAMIYNCPCKSFHLTGPICHFLPLLQSCLFFSVTVCYLILKIIDRQSVEPQSCHRIVTFHSLPLTILNCHFSANS